MPVTRINNNQITDSIAGNTLVGVNAAAKLQNYSITSTKIANNLTYGSDLTISGNLTVNGTTTAVDTVNTLILDPLITLADGQTSGAPTLDIGTIGLRGSQNSAVLAWKESQLEFVTALSTTTVSNTTFTISSYANLHTGNFIAQGTTSLIGNVIGTAQFTGNIVSGNLLTPGLISATGTVTGGNVATGGTVSATANITGGNVLTGGQVSATGNITGGNIISGNAIIGNINVSGDITVNSLTSNTFVSASGNVQAGNVRTAGLISATGNITGGNVAATNFTGTNVSVTGTATAASTVGGVITGSSASLTGGVTAASVAGGVITGSSSSVTGTQTAASTVGGVITGSSVSVTGTATAASTVGGVITGSSTSVTGNTTAGNVLTGGIVSATGTATAGNLLTGGQVSATGTATAGNLLTGGQVSATANVTGGNIITGGIVSATGNINGSNLNITGGIFDTNALTITTATGDLNLSPAGNVNLGTRYLNNVINPVQNQDAATKLYVDNAVSTAISYHQPVVAATTTTLATTTGGTITYTQPNGAANGVGALLTTTGTFNLIDTANVQTLGTRILIKNEANAVFNGVYTWANATNIVRATDADTYGAGNTNALGLNDYFFVSSGNVNLGSAYIVSAPVGTITFGTSNILFAQFSQSQVYTANTSAGLVLNGTVFSAKVDNNTTAFDGGGNISVKAGANLTTPNIGAATGTSLSVTGTVTAASTVGGVITGSSASVTGGVTAASVAGGVITGSSASVTGGVTAASVAGGVITGTSTSVTGTQTAASTVGGVITGSSASVTGGVTAASVAGGVITGTSTSVTGNITGGNILTGGAISGTGNITGGNILTSGNVSATGNVTAAWLIGNIQGSITSPGANTQILFNDGGIANAVSGFTFNKTSNLVTVGGNVNAANFNGNVFGTSVSASGTVTAASTVGGVITGSSASVTGTVTAASTVGGVITGSTASLSGNINGANLILSSGIIDGPAAGRITINGSDIDTDFAVDGDTLANVFYVDAGTGTASFGNSTQVTNALVSFQSTTSIRTPVGNTAQRPSVGVTGMFRFNTTTNSIEVYDNTQWSSVGAPVFTVIADEQFSGNGVQTQFTLSSTQTTNSCIVSINGVVQIPTLAYSVSGTNPTCVLTFTEAPASGDVIDVRQITTTATVTSISNSSGNAIIAVSDTSATITMTGDLEVTGNVSVLGNIATDAIINGTSRVEIPSPNGNIHFDVNGANDVMNIGQFNTVFSGNIILAGNITDTGALTISTGSNGNISLLPNGSGNINTGANIMPTANATSNIGSATLSYNTIFAKATSAQYADLAEKYTADADYAPGTVVTFGGSAEVTLCVNDACSRVAGVISTNPSYRMNDGLQSAHTAMVALTGRVPTSVTGTVRKGDMMVSAGNGVARAEANPVIGTVIGKALADSDSDAVIEIVVGRV